MLTKEECSEALAHLDLMSCRFCQGIDCEKCKFNPKQDYDCGYRKAVNILEELIWEHFKEIGD